MELKKYQQKAIDKVNNYLTEVGKYGPKHAFIFIKEKMDKGIVMWFVPSEAIKSQTLRKFKDRKDIHRQILDDYFDNNVKIFSIEEALKIRKVNSNKV